MVMKIALAAGTRPEFIQLEPIIRELKKRNIEYFFIHSGQHYDYEMDKIFFDEMHLPTPTHYLSIGSKLPGEQIGEIIIASEKILRQEKPDLLLITGDTNTGLGVAIAANKANIRIGHMEAGMRGFDLSIPEEVNRILIDNISHYLFAPTRTGVENLHKGGFHTNVLFVGDVMLDSIQYYQDKIRQPSKTLTELGMTGKKYLLLTLHRQANTDDEKRLRNILRALSSVSLPIIFPIHPRTKQRIQQFNIKIPDNFIIIPPSGYFEFLRLIYNSQKLLTDSGGSQKQAFFLGRPCITFRDNNEYMEIIKNGWNILVDDEEEKITGAISGFNPKGSPDLSLFGNGDCSQKIVDIITSDKTN
jgi:UDP-N-acetylglucosamine 2-epimerase